MSTICLLDHKRVREARVRRNAVIANFERIRYTTRPTEKNLLQLLMLGHVIACLNNVKLRSSATGAEKEASFHRILTKFNSVK